jgi:hypothetical protein
MVGPSFIVVRLFYRAMLPRYVCRPRLDRQASNPSGVGKASFLLGRIINDFFVAPYVDKDRPADLDAYLKVFDKSAAIS